jgi:hypothetical protein
MEASIVGFFSLYSSSSCVAKLKRKGTFWRGAFVETALKFPLSEGTTTLLISIRKTFFADQERGKGKLVQ